MKKYLLAMLSVLAALVTYAALPRVVLTSSDVGKTLADKTIYTINANLTLSGGSHGLVVAENSTVILDIPAGKKLTVKGANAWGMDTTGKAGIYLPPGSTLIITGEGELEAEGGHAAAGSAGGLPGNVLSSVDINPVTITSYAGNGGNGGAGAGAGIGGNGGLGGSGATGASKVHSFTGGTYASSSGVNGLNGSSGSAGTAAGVVCVVNKVKVTTPIQTTPTAADGGIVPNYQYDQSLFYYTGSWGSWGASSWGGGGGGGGGSGGVLACGIGGGAGGGGGGGTGGVGAAVHCKSDDLWKWFGDGHRAMGGYGGVAGSGGANGKQGDLAKANPQDPTTDQAFFGNPTHGRGGGGGGAGANGGSKPIYACASLQLSIGSTSGVNFQSSGVFSGVNSRVLKLHDNADTTVFTTVNVGIGQPVPDRTPPVRQGRNFIGYYGEDGKQYFDANGKACGPLAPYFASFESEIHLYAKWEVVPGAPCVLTSSDIGTTLEHKTIYTIEDDLVLDASSIGMSALSVENMATVILDIPEGKTLTVRGANASGQKGAYAGIYVPTNSTLIVTGKGKLIAAGGSAAAGVAGGSPSSSIQKITDTLSEVRAALTATSGRGGNGGGGAAPGIGGNGGNGGDGAESVSMGESISVSISTIEHWSRSGIDGNDGMDGAAGLGMGRLCVVGSATVTTPIDDTPIEAAAGGTIAKSGTGSYCNYLYSSDSRVWFAIASNGGGGGGGGGAGGVVVQGVCGGAGGGGGGAAGGSGAFGYSASFTIAGWTYVDGLAQGGYGGEGNPSGGQGQYVGIEPQTPCSPAHSGLFGNPSNGSSGQSGSAGSRGASGTICARKENQLDIGTYADGDIKYSSDGIFAGVNSRSLKIYDDEEKTVYNIYVVGLGQAVEALSPPKVENKIFLGYYDENGTMYFDAKGKPVGPLQPYYSDFDTEKILYALWEGTSGITVEGYELETAKGVGWRYDASDMSDRKLIIEENGTYRITGPQAIRNIRIIVSNDLDKVNLQLGYEQYAPDKSGYYNNLCLKSSVGSVVEIGANSKVSILTYGTVTLDSSASDKPAISVGTGAELTLADDLTEAEHSVVKISSAAAVPPIGLVGGTPGTTLITSGYYTLTGSQNFVNLTVSGGYFNDIPETKPPIHTDCMRIKIAEAPATYIYQVSKPSGLMVNGEDVQLRNNSADKPRWKMVNNVVYLIDANEEYVLTGTSIDYNVVAVTNMTIVLKDVRFDLTRGENPYSPIQIGADDGLSRTVTVRIKGENNYLRAGYSNADNGVPAIRTFAGQSLILECAEGSPDAAASMIGQGSCAVVGTIGRESFGQIRVNNGHWDFSQSVNQYAFGNVSGSGAASKVEIYGGYYAEELESVWLAAGVAQISTGNTFWPYAVVEKTGVTVDDVDCCNLTGEGWTYDPTTTNLTFNSVNYYNVAGSNRVEGFTITVKSDSSPSLNLKELTLKTFQPIFTVESNAKLRLYPYYTNALYSTAASAVVLKSNSSFELPSLASSGQINASIAQSFLAISGATRTFEKDATATSDIALGFYGITVSEAKIDSEMLGDEKFSIGRGVIHVAGNEYRLAEVIKAKGVSVNGMDIANESGPGWTYVDKVLTVDPAAGLMAGHDKMVLSGADLDAGTYVMITKPGKVCLKQFRLKSSNLSEYSPMTIDAPCTGDEVVELSYEGNSELNAITTAFRAAIEVRYGSTLVLNTPYVSTNRLTAVGGPYAASIGASSRNVVVADQSILKAGKVIVRDGRYELNNPKAPSETIGRGNYDVNTIESVVIEGGHFSQCPNDDYVAGGSVFGEDSADTQCPYYILPKVGVSVNGIDVVVGSGNGWSYDSAHNHLYLSSENYTYRLAGTSSVIRVQAITSQTTRPMIVELDEFCLKDSAMFEVLDYSYVEIQLREAANGSRLDKIRVNDFSKLTIMSDPENTDPTRARLSFKGYNVGVGYRATLRFESGWFDTAIESFWMDSKCVCTPTGDPVWRYSVSGGRVIVKVDDSTTRYSSLFDALEFAKESGRTSSDVMVYAVVDRVTMDKKDYTMSAGSASSVKLRMSAVTTTEANKIAFTNGYFKVGNNMTLTLEGYGLVLGHIGLSGNGRVSIPCEVDDDVNRIHFRYGDYTREELNSWLTGENREGYSFELMSNGEYWAIQALDCRVHFETHGLGEQPEDQYVRTRSFAANPGDLYADAWFFGGWYKKADFSEPWDFPTTRVVRTNTVIYAQWTLDEKYIRLTNAFDRVGTVKRSLDTKTGVYTYVATLTNSPAIPWTLPDNLGNFTVDMAGITVKGVNGSVGNIRTPGGDGTIPFRMVHVDPVAGDAPTEATFTKGVIQGGNGGNGNPPGLGAVAYTNLSTRAGAFVVAATNLSCQFVKGVDGRLATDLDDWNPNFFRVGSIGRAFHKVEVAIDPLTMTIDYLYGEEVGPKNLKFETNGVVNTIFMNYRPYETPFVLPGAPLDDTHQVRIDNSAAGAFAAVIDGLSALSGTRIDFAVNAKPTSAGARAIIDYVEAHGKAGAVEFVNLKLSVDSAVQAAAADYLTVYLPYGTNGVINVYRVASGSSEVEELELVKDVALASGECCATWGGKMMLKVKKMGDYAFVNELGRTAPLVEWADPYFIESFTNEPAVTSFMMSSPSAAKMMLSGHSAVEAAAMTPAANGELSVLETYAAGFDPSDEKVELKVELTVDEQGKPVITYEPEPRNRAIIEPVTYGKENLDDAWKPATEVPNARFFQLRLESK